MAYGTVNSKPLTTNEHEDHQQREPEQQEEVQQRAQALALKLAQTYEELTRLLERNPGVKRQITEGEAKEDKVYQKLQQRLRMADMGPAVQVGQAGRNELPVAADEAAHLLFCAQADGGSQDADADAAGAGRRQRDPGWVDADTEGAD